MHDIARKCVLQKWWLATQCFFLKLQKELPVVKTVSQRLTFSLLLWDHGRRLWEGLANLAICSRVSSYRGKRGREERKGDFRTIVEADLHPNNHPQPRIKPRQAVRWHIIT